MTIKTTPDTPDWLNDVDDDEIDSELALSSEFQTDPDVVARLQDQSFYEIRGSQISPAQLRAFLTHYVLVPGFRRRVKLWYFLQDSIHLDTPTVEQAARIADSQGWKHAVLLRDAGMENSLVVMNLAQFYQPLGDQYLHDLGYWVADTELIDEESLIDLL